MVNLFKITWLIRDRARIQTSLAQVLILLTIILLFPMENVTSTSVHEAVETQMRLGD